MGDSATRLWGYCVRKDGRTFFTHLIDSDTDACRDCGFAPGPEVQWDHIDGPLMRRAGGTLKWLTWRERFMHWIGAWSLEDISKRPSL
jgi:hypothetical protein